MTPLSLNVIPPLNGGLERKKKIPLKVKNNRVIFFYLKS